MKTILAISGGVDSMALLNMIAVNKVVKNSEYVVEGEYVVAHFDHGIRIDSGEDAELVRATAERVGLKFELGSVKLGEGASEEAAREARYEFLYDVMKRHEADKILTAHHFDDRLETMLINVKRGTSLKGMLGFGQKIFVERPLFNWLKDDILEYAKENGVKWREDSTNTSDRYLRNSFRQKLESMSDAKKLSWRTRLNKLTDEVREIDKITEELTIWACGIDHPTQYFCDCCGDRERILRARFSLLPVDIGQMILHRRLVDLEAKDITEKKIITLALAIRTGKAGKIYDICDHLVLKLSVKTAEICERG
jgi:tRNA(Ile)-lysidine synthetase-like protein